MRNFLENIANFAVFRLNFVVFRLYFDENFSEFQEIAAKYCKMLIFQKKKIFVNIQYSRKNKYWNFVSLRYFNPIGAHPSGMFGEAPIGIPNNLFPYICQVASSLRDKLSIFGNDWPTSDGTGIRDYIHVTDLAEGHLSALKKLLENNYKQIYKLNLGSGKGHSVLDVIKTFSKVTGVDIPYEISNRRSGDTGQNVADPSLSKKTLGWETKMTLFEMCRDSWNWQTKNPNGYN